MKESGCWMRGDMNTLSFFSTTTTKKQGWKPPFSIDTEHFEFTPRLQPLNELDVSFWNGSM